MGPGRTGVKGVIRDRAEAESLARAKRANEIKDLNRAMEKASLGGKTWAEEEKERLEEIQSSRRHGRGEDDSIHKNYERRIHGTIRATLIIIDVRRWLA